MVIRALACLLVAAAAACALDNPPAPQALDEAFFRCRVEPVLIDSCAFYACHGTPERALRLYAPNRLRLDVGEAERALALTEDEHAHNYRAAIRFAQPVDGYAEALLVDKPLDAALGGAFHRGAEDYGGGDVFVDEADRDLDTLRRWLRGAMEDLSCVP
jgi:hypothetical protein